MRDLITEPDIDRRELLESVALEAVPAAVDDVMGTLARLPSAVVPVAVWPDLRRFAEVLLRAVLTCYVQGAVSVDDHERLLAEAQSIADPPLVHEVLRTVRLVGIEALNVQLRRAMDVSRAEHLRLRESAERIEALIAQAVEVAPPRADVLKRLQATGSDLR